MMKIPGQSMRHASSLKPISFHTRNGLAMSRRFTATGLVGGAEAFIYAAWRASTRQVDENKKEKNQTDNTCLNKSKRKISALNQKMHI